MRGLAWRRPAFLHILGYLLYLASNCTCCRQKRGRKQRLTSSNWGKIRQTLDATRCPLRYYDDVVQPTAGMVVVKHILFDGMLVISLGIVVAFLNKPKADGIE